MQVLETKAAGTRLSQLDQPLSGWEGALPPRAIQGAQGRSWRPGEGRDVVKIC